MSDTVEKKSGAAKAGWICFILGIVLMFISLWTVFVYGPLFFASFILAIIAMTKKQVGNGVALLICSLIVPWVVFAGLGAVRGSDAIAKINEAVEESSPSVEKAAAAAIGSPVKTPSFEILVSSIKRRSRVGNDMFTESPAEGGTYLAVQWDYKNISKAPIGMFEQPSIHLIDPNKAQYDADVGASTAYSTELDLNEKIVSDLNPGIKVRSASVFEVSTEILAKPGWKILIDADEDIVIAL